MLIQINSYKTLCTSLGPLIVEQFLCFPCEISLGLVILGLLSFLALVLPGIQDEEMRQAITYRITVLSSFFLTLLGVLAFLIKTYPFGVSVANTFLITNPGINFLHVLTLMSSGFILNYFRVYYPRRYFLELPFLFLFSVWFLLILLVANHLLVMLMGLIGFSISLYVLLLLFQDQQRLGHEAALKYFLFSALSTGMILVALVFIFLVTNSWNMLVVALQEGNPYLADVSFFELGYPQFGKNTGFGLSQFHIATKILIMTLLAVGFAFKLSAFPSHTWAPEVYEGSSNPVTAFILIPVKLACFGILARLLSYTLWSSVDTWSSIVQLIGFSSLLLGLFGALTEKKFKRFLAFSSINQMGFVFLGLSCADMTLTGTFYFFFIYILSNVSLFASFLLISKKWWNIHSIVYLTDLSLISKGRWIVRLGLTVVFLSLAGLPPFLGFLAKFHLLQDIFNWGHPVAVLLGLVVSIVSAYYYLRVAKLLWFEDMSPKESFSFSSGQAGAAVLSLSLLLLVPFDSIICDLAQHTSEGTRYPLVPLSR